jgi:hypothetical protein
MIATLCNELKEQLDLNWLDVKHGLAFTNKVDLPGAGKVSVPFEWGIEECKNGNFISPDAKKRSVSWFESDGLNMKNKVEHGLTTATQLSFCNWINCKLIDKDDPFIQDKVMSLAESAIANLKNTTLGPIRIIRVQVVKINVGADKILGKYGFTDKAMMSIHPYFGYNIVFNLEFTSHVCEPITLNPC